MTYPKHLFKHPGPYGKGDRSYAVAGAADEAEEAELIARGWSPKKPRGPVTDENIDERHAAAKASRDALDHDGDGEKGGSIAPEGDLKALRAEYLDKMGKRPFPGWDEAELRKRMAG